MGTRINVKKPEPDKCWCGKPLPCPDHTGTDGDTMDDYVPKDKNDK